MHRNLKLVVLILSLTLGTTDASENFMSNPNSVYPPGCATLIWTEYFYQSQWNYLYSGKIELGDADDTIDHTFHEVDLWVIKRNCADSNRSTIQVMIQTPNSSFSTIHYSLPLFQASINGENYPLSAFTEPNTFVAYAPKVLQSGGGLSGGNLYQMYLDAPSIYENYKEGTTHISAEQFNNGFELVISTGRGTGVTVSIPPTNDILSPGTLPLNGRLSGVWVAEGAADQGFVFSFNDLPPHKDKASVFLSWYTFDSNGQYVWLTGSAFFELGASSVEIPIVLVNNGEFLGGKTADRIIVGSVQLSARSCNELNIAFELPGANLGSGNVDLVRFDGLETMGYACRDWRARESSP